MWEPLLRIGQLACHDSSRALLSHNRKGKLSGMASHPKKHAGEAALAAALLVMSLHVWKACTQEQLLA